MKDHTNDRDRATCLFTNVHAGPVEEMSLDHDLGMDAVIDRLSPEGRRAITQLGDVSGVSLPPEDDGILLLRAMEIVRSGRHHQESGYAFCCWLEETGLWPRTKPRVHSANAAGAARMRMVIERAYPAQKGFMTGAT